MPTILRKDGYTFKIYLNDHTPAHVHVRKGKKEARVTLDGLEIVSNINFLSREVKRILEIIEEHQDELLAAWDEYHERRI